MSDKSDNTAGRSAPEWTIVTPPSMKSKYWCPFVFWTIAGQTENTRWNSTYDTICRASEQAAAATVIFEKKLLHLELTTNKWIVVENIRDLPLRHILINKVKNFASSEIPVIKSGLKYPHLAQLAKKYLCVPGTSVSSERVFSTARNIVNKKRAALDPEQVDRLVFLANNI
ncbi:ZBED1 protein, partial [Polyodon spathula]|nr:ZBED1 protein [Polyodon spathula]